MVSTHNVMQFNLDLIKKIHIKAQIVKLDVYRYCSIVYDFIIDFE